MIAPSDAYSGYQDAPAVTVIVIVCSTLALYNALELLLLILSTFHAYRGLYFSSLVASSFGILLYVVGFLLEYFLLAPQAAGIAIASTGWVLMVTGQSVVLYSRLGVVMGKGRHKLLKAVKWMIVVDAIVFHSTTTIAVFGARFGAHTQTFNLAYVYIEKIQMTAFTIQELIISGLYIHQTLQILRSRSSFAAIPGTRPSSNSHRIMYQLFGINVIIIALDAGLLTIEYLNWHVMEQTFKAVTYSVKLKLEFAILSKLVEITRDGARGSCFSSDWAESSAMRKRGNSHSTEWWDVGENYKDAPMASVFHKSGERRPGWMHKAEDDGVEHTELVYSRGQGVDPGEGSGGMKHGTAADVLYADALRSLDC